jgi:hypothetical protein
MKVGDNVYCFKNCFVDEDISLIKGKIYKLKTPGIDNCKFSIFGENKVYHDMTEDYAKDYVILLSEYRKEKLQKINNFS